MGADDRGTGAADQGGDREPSGRAGPDGSSADRDPLGLRAALQPSPGRRHPWCSGAVALAGRGDDVLVHQAVGWAVRYARYDERTGRGVELPPEQRVPTRPDTVFDLASLTKVFTAIAALQQVESGRIALDAPAAGFLPGFAGGGKAAITVRHLLTHTSGLRAELPFHALPTRAARLGLLYGDRPVAPPGTAYRYSDLNLIAVQLVLERVTGRPLDALVREGITGPLGMADTCFRPPGSWRRRVAATEDQRRPWARLDRGMLRGAVHDENAHAFGGIAGHAGMFSTAADLGVLCRALLGGGGGVLAPGSVRLMLKDGSVPGHPHGLGLELDQRWFMGELAGPRTAGHTGFTGTSLLIDFEHGRYLVLLANSVHPCRWWRDGSEPRARAATALARLTAGSTRKWFSFKI